MVPLDPGFCKWEADRMWRKGQQLFATDERGSEINRIAFQLSLSKEITIVKQKYKGTWIFLLYVHKNEFPIVPTLFYYLTIDAIEGVWFHLSDVLSMYRGNHATFPGGDPDA